MFALGAAVCFGLQFLLLLIGQTISAKFSLLYLGLTLLAIHLAAPLAAGYRKGRRR